MSYDRAPYHPNQIRYARPQFTLTSNASFAFTGPKGKKGRLLDYGIDDISTTTGGATNTPKVQVGINGTLAQFGAPFDVGVLTAPNAASVAATFRRAADPPATGVNVNWSNLMVLEDIPAGTQVLLSLIGATGAGAAGVGTVFMIIAWDD